MMCMRIRAVLQRLLLLFLLSNTSQSFSTTPVSWTILEYFFVTCYEISLCQQWLQWYFTTPHPNTQSDSVSLDTSCTNLCSQRHEVTTFPEPLLHERTTGLKITTSIIYIAPTLLFNSLPYPEWQQLQCHVGFLKFFPPLLSSSIIKLQDSNQNKNPSSLAVSWEASRGRAISLLLRHLSSKPDPVHPVHPYFRYILQYIVHFSTYYIPVMCVYTQVKEEELWSQW